MSVIQILDDADAAFRILGAELRTVLSVTTMFADKPHRLNGRTSAQRFCVLTILLPVTALAVGLPAQRAIAQRFRALAPFGHAEAVATCLLLGEERTLLRSAPRSEFDPSQTSSIREPPDNTSTEPLEMSDLTRPERN